MAMRRAERSPISVKRQAPLPGARSTTYLQGPSARPGRTWLEPATDPAVRHARRCSAGYVAHRAEANTEGCTNRDKRDTRRDSWWSTRGCSLHEVCDSPCQAGGIAHRGGAVATRITISANPSWEIGEGVEPHELKGHTNTTLSASVGPSHVLLHRDLLSDWRACLCSLARSMSSKTASEEVARSTAAHASRTSTDRSQKLLVSSRRTSC
jgi:hypothetical protein